MVKDNLADKNSNTSDAILNLLENIEKGGQPPFFMKIDRNTYKPQIWNEIKYKLIIK